MMYPICDVDGRRRAPRFCETCWLPLGGVALRCSLCGIRVCDECAVEHKRLCSAYTEPEDTEVEAALRRSHAVEEQAINARAAGQEQGK